MKRRRRMIEKLGVVRPQVQKVLDRLTSVPVDIEPQLHVGGYAALSRGFAVSTVGSGFSRIDCVNRANALGSRILPAEVRQAACPHVEALGVKPLDRFTGPRVVC